MKNDKRNKVKDELGEALIIGVPLFTFIFETFFYIFGNNVGMTITFVIGAAIMVAIWFIFCKGKNESFIHEEYIDEDEY